MFFCCVEQREVFSQKIAHYWQDQTNSLSWFILFKAFLKPFDL
ncbi:hypothetical protein D922_03533 [Enterococcus faecalis 06-MB-DW-09]|nr:hypothetical protein D922_03533 [Enterococcus faecalis 06-MB-DW-09]